MPQFVHLADDRDISMIRKNGIIARKFHRGTGKHVFATPVLQNYYQSHQWLRELKRCGIRTISAVQFVLPDDAEVAVGRYNEDKLACTAAEAVKIFMEHADGLGLEVMIPVSISPKSITRVYTPDQVTGWRYYPESHSDGRKPCGCSYCQRGQINNRRLREAYERECQAASAAEKASKVFGTWRSDSGKTNAYLLKHARMTDQQRELISQLFGRMVLIYNPDGTGVIRMEPGTLRLNDGSHREQAASEQTFKFEILGETDLQVAIKMTVDMPTNEDEPFEILKFHDADTYSISLSNGENNINSREFFKRVKDGK